MDYTSLTTAGVSSTMVAVLYAIYKIFKHSACTSSCCGRTVDVSIDLEADHTVVNGATSQSHP